MALPFTWPAARALAIAAVAYCALVTAQSYPGRTVRILAPEPGGGADFVAPPLGLWGDDESPRLIAEIEKLEQKIRRPDLLVDDRFLFDWYDAKLPERVTSLQRHEQWLAKATPDEVGPTARSALSSA